MKLNYCPDGYPVYSVRLESEGLLVGFPVETDIFILTFSLVFCSLHLGRALANEIKHYHSPVVIFVFDPKYD